jgi:MoxR-like ATPase
MVHSGVAAARAVPHADEAATRVDGGAFKASVGPIAPLQAASRMAEVRRAIATVIMGKDQQIRLCLACLLADGHILIDDIPGVGKTTLAHALALALGLQFTRQQFTSDMLPSDVLGASIFSREEGRFIFHPGPIFSQVVLADEINRASPKTQSALLEAMEERQVSLDGQTRPLPKPFFVIATQNPLSQIGTHPLPESQLDRFLMRVTLGYPDRESEVGMLLGENPRSRLTAIRAVLDAVTLEQIQEAVGRVKVSRELALYIHRIVETTRMDGKFCEGLSPRAMLMLLAAARAWALLDGRAIVLPDDVQAVFPSVASHRLRRKLTGSAGSEEGDRYFERWLKQIPVES